MPDGIGDRHPTTRRANFIPAIDGFARRGHARALRSLPDPKILIQALKPDRHFLVFYVPQKGGPDALGVR
jgi:hypothetical protein